MSAQMATVRWFNDKRGYGFLSLADGSDVFCHHSAIEMKGYRILREGQYVQVGEVVNTPKGLQASRVVPLDDGNRVVEYEDKDGQGFEARPRRGRTVVYERESE